MTRRTGAVLMADLPNDRSLRGLHRTSRGSLRLSGRQGDGRSRLRGSYIARQTLQEQKNTKLTQRHRGAEAAGPQPLFSAPPRLRVSIFFLSREEVIAAAAAQSSASPGPWRSGAAKGASKPRVRSIGGGGSMTITGGC